MEEILVTDRPDFTVAEEPDEPERANPFLHHFRIVIWPSEQVLTAAVTGTKATAVNRRRGQFLLGTG